MNRYRVLLADDEITSIRYLRNLIHAQLPEYEIVQESQTGLDAFEYLKHHQVDLLITDIRMPGIDGIELARRARALDKGLHIVIVSGHSEFEYAKGAIASGVDDYLLKPLSIDQVAQVLSGIGEKLDERYGALRVELLGRLLKGEQFDSELCQRLFDKKGCLLAVLRWGNLPMLRDIQAHRKDPTRHLPEIERLTLLQARDAQEWVIMSQDMQPQDFRERLIALSGSEQAAHTIVTQLDLAAVSDIAASVRALLSELDARLVIGQSQLIVLPAPESNTPPHLQLSDLRKLDFYLSSAKQGPLKELMLSWMVEWERARLPERWVEAAIDQIAERAMALRPLLHEKRLEIRRELAEVFLYANTLGDVMLGTWDILFAPLSQPAGESQRAEALLARIQGDILGNCAGALSMQSVSERHGISQTYLSRLFRRYSGTTFGEYLTECRMQTAKGLMRAHPELLLKDVALCAGYEDASYFSKVFQRQMGMTPSQYAESIREC